MIRPNFYAISVRGDLWFHRLPSVQYINEVSESLLYFLLFSKSLVTVRQKRTIGKIKTNCDFSKMKPEPAELCWFYRQVSDCKTVL